MEETIYIPSLLVISGNNRNNGKTWLTCQILEKFSESITISAIKISPHFHQNMGKFQETGEHFFYMEEKNEGSGKDSSKMLDSGANKVFYIESNDKGLQENVNALQQLIGKKACICESGAISKFVKPSLFIYINGPEGGKNQEVKNKADIILDNHNGKVYFDLSKLTFEKGSWYYRD